MRRELRCVECANEVYVDGGEVRLLGRVTVAIVGKYFILSVDAGVRDNEGNLSGRGEGGCGFE